VNRDKINNADPKAVSKATFALLDRLQNFPVWMQPVAAAAAMLLLSEGLKLSAQDLFTVTKNLMNSKEGLRPEFEAVRDYVKHELKGK
jgi:hypothetical protein